MDHHWCSFSLLKSAERRKGLRADNYVAIMLLDRLLFVKQNVPFRSTARHTITGHCSALLNAKIPCAKGERDGARNHEYPLILCFFSAFFNPP